MKRFSFPVPPGWVAVSAGRFTIGDVALRVTELGPMPEDLPRYLEGQVRQLAGGAPAPPTALALRSGWPAHATDATSGEVRRMVIAIEMIELGVLVHLDGPVASFEAARAEVIEALGQGAVEWAAPSQPTLAELFTGVRRDP